jgi:hypothetical protein
MINLLFSALYHPKKLRKHGPQRRGGVKNTHFFRFLLQKIQTE